jgi:hypothetical protein
MDNRIQQIISSNNRINQRSQYKDSKQQEVKHKRHHKVNLLMVNRLSNLLMVNLLKVNLAQHLNLFVQNSVKLLMKKFKQQKKQQDLILLV